MSKHTPGPWKQVAVPGGWDGVADTEGQTICTLNLNNPENARLIAAAPALLAACKAVTERYHHELPTNIYRKLRAAIALAEEAVKGVEGGLMAEIKTVKRTFEVHIHEGKVQLTVPGGMIPSSWKSLSLILKSLCESEALAAPTEMGE